MDAGPKSAVGSALCRLDVVGNTAGTVPFLPAETAAIVEGSCQEQEVLGPGSPRPERDDPFQSGDGFTVEPSCFGEVPGQGEQVGKLLRERGALDGGSLPETV